MGPLIWVREYTERNDLAEVGEAVSVAMALVGNATAHLSTERRKSLMNKDLRPTM